MVTVILENSESEQRVSALSLGPMAQVTGADASAQRHCIKAWPPCARMRAGLNRCGNTSTYDASPAHVDYFWSADAPSGRL